MILLTHAPELRRRRAELQRAARWTVTNAVRRGTMQPASAFSCVDCGRVAAHWEHRDYRKPLDVEPVCAQCNANRPPAAPYAPADVRELFEGLPLADNQQMRDLFCFMLGWMIEYPESTFWDGLREAVKQHKIPLRRSDA